MFKIEKNIPLLPRRQNSHLYPFSNMQRGDSFALPAEKRNACANAAYMYGHRNNMKFSIRKNGSGYRCWRVV